MISLPSSLSLTASLRNLKSYRPFILPQQPSLASLPPRNAEQGREKSLHMTRLKLRLFTVRLARKKKKKESSVHTRTAGTWGNQIEKMDRLTWLGFNFTCDKYFCIFFWWCLLTQTCTHAHTRRQTHAHRYPTLHTFIIIAVLLYTLFLSLS